MKHPLGYLHRRKERESERASEREKRAYTVGFFVCDRVKHAVLKEKLLDKEERIA